MTRLREQPLRVEPYLTRDYINRAVKLREIESLMNAQKMTGWRLVGTWLAMFVGSWLLAGAIIYGVSWVLQ